MPTTPRDDPRTERTTREEEPRDRQRSARPEEEDPIVQLGEDPGTVEPERE
jgi:hypothetical protein